MELYLLFASIILVFRGITGEKWNYNRNDNEYGPAHWEEYDEECGATRQSPIHIQTNETKYNMELMQPMIFINYASGTPELSLQNSAHGTKVTVKTDKPMIYGAGFGYRYVLQQFHFHFGVDNTRGSEHLLDSDDYASEVHFVHYREDINEDQVLTTPNGVAVLGILFKGGGADHPGYEKVLGYLDQIGNSTAKHDIDSFPLEELLPSNLRKFYRYNGSLTTPPCSETVIWTMFQEFITLSDKQIARLRKLQYEGKLVPLTYRPIQPINGRTVYTSWMTNQMTWEASGAPRRQSMYITTWMVVALSAAFRHLF